MENINLIHKIAWSFHKSTGMDVDDLIQEASLIYLEAIKTYDPSKGKLSTYIWKVTKNHLQYFVTYQNKWNDKTISIEEVDIDKPVSRYSLFDSLTREAKDIVDVVLSAPAEFDSLIPAKARKRVINKLRGKHWNMVKIAQGMDELKSVLN